MPLTGHFIISEALFQTEPIASDADLWTAFREGDNQALGLLAERYYRTLRRYGMKFMVDPGIVEDAIQDIFLDLSQKRHRINHTESVKFYLLKALRHHLIAHLRYHQRFTGESALEWDHSFPENLNAESLLIEQETLSGLTCELHRQLSNLPKREREALYLRYYEDLSVHEIAELMGVNRQSVSNFLQKALHKIRSKWVATTMVLYLFFF